MINAVKFPRKTTRSTKALPPVAVDKQLQVSTHGEWKKPQNAGAEYLFTTPTPRGLTKRCNQFTK